MLIRNARDLLSFQHQFLEKMEQRMQTTGIDKFNVGELFMEMQGFEVYSQYCTQHDSALKILSSLEKREEMRVLMKEFRRGVDNYDIRDFLIKPVQRICRYPLMIKEVMKCSEGDVQLEKAYIKMQGVAAEIDR